MKLDKWPEWVSIFHGLLIMVLIGVGCYTLSKFKAARAAQEKMDQAEA